jgi:hypothetical protein
LPGKGGHAVQRAGADVRFDGLAFDVLDVQPVAARKVIRPYWRYLDMLVPRAIYGARQRAGNRLASTRNCLGAGRLDKSERPWHLRQHLLAFRRIVCAKPGECDPRSAIPAWTEALR